jgi:RimJ/RimL family protein N-acetyltransferase
MFLHKNYRGQGIASSLLQTIIHWCVDNNVNAIYLGTMTQFERAQKFYENNHFERIDVGYLPSDFPVNPIDSICKFRFKLTPRTVSN